MNAPRRVLYHGLLVASRLLRQLSNACIYLAAGTHTRDDLAAAMQVQFDGFGDEPDYARRGLSPFEADIIERWLPQGGRTLVIGCGPGRELVSLVGRGHSVVGVEQSHDCAARARENLAALGLSAIVVTRLDDASREGTFSAVLFSESCYSDIQGSHDRMAALRRSASMLSPGGVLVIFYLANQNRSRTALRLMTLGAWLARASWRPEPGDSFIPSERGTLLFNHTFRDGEVAAECEASGYTILAERTSGRLRCLVARRQDRNPV